ncbi:hypothetical protein N7520_010740 [Penicillium odoratum]|uniref:uncharacterized protein n=1 Tax=Penicillium odoratum TaxID=1167516 RepID=UPI002546A6CF|nr:uncharacterized protein N7520_010740 [Penicillium odoratum]KAJ5745558.1 hypothetical protein N7520_010740 [Penicillium odoratum]
MADSDEEYVGDVTEDEDDLQVTRKDQIGTRKRKQRGGAEWELSRTWETLVEGADGTISATVEGLLEAGKRKRLLKDTTPLQRGIIRHLILVLDLSQSMSEKDLRPTRYLLTLRYAQEFVREFFEQNPISQLGVLGLRDGLAVRISNMSGNPTEHMKAIQSLKTQDPKGLPSLQNGLEMARGALFHTPKHGTREVLVIFGSLLSSDPGDIHQTINTLINDKVRVRIVGLAAQVAICRELCTKTNGGDETTYGVALNEQHFRELMMDVTTPPATYSLKQSASSLLMMGFPSRTVEARPSLCACHSKPSRGGYLCSRCGSKPHESNVPSDSSNISIPEKPVDSEPIYPSSFAHIVELITTGQPIPGIEQIPDTVLTGHEISSEKPRRRKPWEKDEMEPTKSEYTAEA